MRRITLLVMLMATALLAASGVALAKTLIGGPGPDKIYGTNGPDKLAGGGGNDLIAGFKGGDTIVGEGGNDTLSAGPTRESALDGVDGGPGNDVISIYNKPASLDGISCGPGTDTLFYDKKDQYFPAVKRPDCEKVYNRAP